MTAGISMSVLSTQYVLMPVATQAGGTIIDPTTDAVACAFKPVGAEPAGADWVPATWLQDTTPGTFIAECLVGPAPGSAITLDPGIYTIWLKITDNPEVPVLQPGTLQITEP